MSKLRASTLSVLKTAFQEKVIQLGLFPFFQITPTPSIKRARPESRIRSRRKSVEILDVRWSSSDLELKKIWQKLASEYFPNRPELLEYKLKWSERSQKRVLGSCNLTKKKVLIARSLDRPELNWVLDPLIYHEMCHAVVGVGRSKNGRRNSFHSDTFYSLEKLHPRIEELDIWIKSGGWQSAVRSFSSHRGFLKRRQTK